MLQMNHFHSVALKVLQGLHHLDCIRMTGFQPNGKRW